MGQQIGKTQKWPQDWKRSIFIPVPKKSNAKGCSNYCTTALISHVSTEASTEPATPELTLMSGPVISFKFTEKEMP